MSDLVERARKYAWQFRRCNTDTGPIIEQLCDEVERLRAENEQARELLREIAEDVIPFSIIHNKITEFLKDE